MELESRSSWPFPMSFSHLVTRLSVASTSFRDRAARSFLAPESIPLSGPHGFRVHRLLRDVGVASRVGQLRGKRPEALKCGIPCVLKLFTPSGKHPGARGPRRPGRGHLVSRKSPRCPQSGHASLCSRQQRASVPVAPPGQEVSSLGEGRGPGRHLGEGEATSIGQRLWTYFNLVLEP